MAVRSECTGCAEFRPNMPNGCLRLAHGLKCVHDTPSAETIADIVKRFRESTPPGKVVEPPPGEQPPSALDTQVGGGHYKDFPIQPAEFITKNKLGFLEGCVIKRMCRWRAKNGVEDLKKAIHEIELLIELTEKSDAR